MESLLSYVQLFREDYRLRFLNVRILEIVQEMIFSNILSTDSRATYLRYCKVPKMMMKNQGVLSLFWRLGQNPPAAKTLAITHLDGPRLYIFFEANTFHMNLATNLFV